MTTGFDHPSDTVLVRGGGDLASGVVWRLTRLGWPVVVTELPNPLTVRRTVSLSSAVSKGEVNIDGLVGRRCRLDGRAVAELLADGTVPVVVSPELPSFDFWAVVDARLAKQNLDTKLDDATAVVGLGPGFNAGVDCHAVIETNRGPNLGRVLWNGSAEPNTGTPGLVAGWGRERVLRAPANGSITWRVAIGEQVRADQTLGSVDGADIEAPFDGVVRGLIAEGPVTEKLKVGDVDPRNDPRLCHQISDKALAVGGGVAEAIAVLRARAANAAAAPAADQ